MVPAVTGEDSGALCSALGDGLGLAGLQVTSVPWTIGANSYAMNSHHPKVLKWGNGGQLMSIKSPSLTTFEPPVDDGLMISSPSLRDSIGTHGKQVATGSFGGILCATVVTYF